MLDILRSHDDDLRRVLRAPGTIVCAADFPNHDLDILHKRYRFVREIGRGTFGRVVCAEDIVRGDQVAVKQVELSHLSDRARFQCEVVALRLARLPGVVQLRDSFESALPPGWTQANTTTEDLAATMSLAVANEAAPSPRTSTHAFVVMDLIGGAYYGAGGPHRWETIREETERLAVNLTRLHIAGIVHRDIKPNNVLVSNGHPVFLDLGISAGPAMRSAASSQGTMGALRYSPPELRRFGRWCARSDIYSVGVMIWGALAGRGFLSRVPSRELLGTRHTDPPYEELPEEAEAPDHLRRLLRTMLAHDPEERPDGVAVCEALGIKSPTFDSARLSGISDPARPEQLRGLFAGPDIFLHLQEDAASVLTRRTGGDLSRVAAELKGWVLDNRARDVDGLLQMTADDLRMLDQGRPVLAPTEGPPDPFLCAVRALFPHATRERVATVLDWHVDAVAKETRERATVLWSLPDGSLATELRRFSGAEVELLRGWANHLAAVLPPDAEQRVHLLGLLRPDDPQTVEDMCVWMERAIARGDHGGVISTHATALDAARVHRDGLGEARILACVVEGAALHPQPEHIDRARRLLAEAETTTPGLSTLGALATATEAWRDGRFQESHELISQSEACALDRVEMTRMAMGAILRTRARVGGVEPWLEQWEAWAMERPERAARWYMAKGRFEYSNGRFSQAAEWFRQAADIEPTRTGSVRYRSDELFALLDDDQCDVVMSRVSAALDQARACREATSEVRLTHLRRAAAYRCGLPVEVEPELAVAAAAVAPRLAGLLVTVDAALLWRSGQFEQLKSVAAGGLGLLRSGDAPWASVLLRALRAAAGDEADAAWVDQTWSNQLAPGLALQAAALVHSRFPQERHRERVRDFVEMFPTERRQLRREVLSIEECRSILGI